MPLIAMEYAFAGGGAQDPADKPGVANLVADLLDEGSGDLDSNTFHERLDRRAIELSFSATRDYFRGSLRMLRDNKDEAFDLLRMSLTSAHFDATDVERIRSQVISGLRRDTTNPNALAGRKFLEVAYGDHPYGRQVTGTPSHAVYFAPNASSPPSSSSLSFAAWDQTIGTNGSILNPTGQAAFSAAPSRAGWTAGD